MQHYENHDMEAPKTVNSTQSILLLVQGRISSAAKIVALVIQKDALDYILHLLYQRPLKK